MDIKFPDERSKRMFEDGKSIAMVADVELGNLIKENELYLKDLGVDIEQQRFLCSILMARMLIVSLNCGISAKLVPGVLRLAANSAEVMIQNHERDKKEKE